MCGDCVGPISRRQSLRLGVGALAMLALPYRPARTGSVPPPEIYPRETWAGGLPPLGPMQAEDVRFLLVHHTAGASDYSEQGAIEQMRQAYALHTGPEKGWPDVCYNFFVDRFGRVFEARAGSLDGAVMADATGGSQGYAQLVCLLGDFTSHMPSDAAISSLIHTLAWTADRFSVDTTPGATVDFISRGSDRWPAGTPVTAATISGHRDMSLTACPGDTFYPYVHDGLAADVDDFRRAAAPGPTTTTTVPIVVTSPTAAPATTVIARSTTVSGPDQATTPMSASSPTVAESSGSTAPTSILQTRSTNGRGKWWAAGASVIVGGVVAALAASRRRRPPTGDSTEIT